MRTVVTLAITAALAACGNDSGARGPDAAPGAGDALGDGAPGSAPVTLTIKNAGSGVSGIKVYFQNGDSSLVAEAVTSASGSATAVLAAGGYVTAVVPNTVVSATTPNTALSTFSDVQPGDQLVLDTTIPTTSAHTQLTVPLYAGSTTDTYVTFESCDYTAHELSVGSGNAFSWITALPDTCASTDVATWVYAGTNFVTPVAVGYVPDVAIGASVDLTALTYVAPRTVATTYTDVPSAAKSLFVTQHAVTPRGTLGAYGARVPLVGGSGSATVYQVTGDTTVLTYTTPDFGSASYADEEVLETGASAATYTLDVNASLLHGFPTPPRFDPPSHTVAWTEDTVGVAPDLQMPILHVVRGAASWSWQLAAPRAGTSVTYPVLPTDVFDFNAAADDAVTVQQLETYKLPGGYAAARTDPFDPYYLLALLGTRGRLTVERYRFGDVYARRGQQAASHLLAPTLLHR